MYFNRTLGTVIHITVQLILLLLFGRGSAVVRASASDYEVGGSGFEPSRYHLAGHISDPIMSDSLMRPK